MLLSRSAFVSFFVPFLGRGSDPSRSFVFIDCVTVFFARQPGGKVHNKKGSVHIYPFAANTISPSFDKLLIVENVYLNGSARSSRCYASSNTSAPNCSLGIKQLACAVPKLVWDRAEHRAANAHSLALGYWL